MLKIGITGQSGFIGNHLYNYLRLLPELYTVIDFQKAFFEDEGELDAFVSHCDVIVHLAAMNRHSDQEVIYKTNIRLVQVLIASLKRTNSDAHVIMSSSLQEEYDNLYGRSKKDGRELFLNWEGNSNGTFSGLIVPNVFGPFGRANHNSVVATFCHNVVNDEKIEIHVDNNLGLIYVGDLVQEILEIIEKGLSNEKVIIKPRVNIKVSEILNLIIQYKKEYQDKGEIPILNSGFEVDLFNTYRAYIDIKSHFPVKLAKHSDSRGTFVEIIRLGNGGQVSFSTTAPNIIRGNHFHTRKIERFAVIKGKALIQLRKIGTDKIFEFYLDGDEPAYVDMPIWYTHNIKNIGNDVLYTNFWINEKYDPEDTDTYILEV